MTHRDNIGITHRDKTYPDAVHRERDNPFIRVIPPDETGRQEPDAKSRIGINSTSMPSLSNPFARFEGMGAAELEQLLSLDDLSRGEQPPPEPDGPHDTRTAPVSGVTGPNSDHAPTRFPPGPVGSDTQSIRVRVTD